MPASSLQTDSGRTATRLFFKPLATAVAFLAFITVVAAVPGQTYAQSDVDRKLLEDLSADRVDEFDRELFAPQNGGDRPGADNERKSKSPPETPPTAADRLGDEIVRELLEELRRADETQRRAMQNAGSVEPSARANPLVDVARQMRTVEQRLENADSGQQTQDGQKRIMDQLDLMIEQMKKSCCKGGKPGGQQKQGGTCERKNVEQAKKPSACNKPGGGASPGESTANANVQDPGAAARRADREQIHAVVKRLWGELPERDRERLLQYPVEQFLPEYERMIEEYYKRLSEEDSARQP